MSYRRTFVLPIILIMVFILYLSDDAVAMAVLQSDAVVPAVEQEMADSVSDNHTVSEQTEDTQPPAESGAPAEPEETAAMIMTPVTEPQTDYVSTGEELMAWMEEHKNSGGSVRLTDHVSMDHAYVFVPTQIQSAGNLVVDTAEYTITVTDEIELWSNGRVTFTGNANDRGIFHVASGGMLYIQGINVENRQSGGEQPPEMASRYILWQEEGAGLALYNCRISGDIHYAQTPFVMYENSVYAIAEKGQTAIDVLPSQISCDVIEQGTISDRQMPVSWNMEGTTKQQEERLRFTVKGTFVNAASAHQPVCTMIYNDYPLTFTDVKAGVGNGYYSFRGSYTRPKEYVPMTITTEYSFDGDNWFVDEETKVSDANEPTNFFIGFQDMVRGTGTRSYVYIRLRGEYNDTCYLSNVLRYDTDNLAVTEEIGGGRGGGTSVVNPSDTPEKEPVHATSTQPVNNAEGSTGVNANGDGISTQDTGSQNAAAPDGTATITDLDVQPSSQTSSDAKEPSTNPYVQASSGAKSSAAGSYDAAASDTESVQAGQITAESTDTYPEENGDNDVLNTELVHAHNMQLPDAAQEEKTSREESLQEVSVSVGNAALVFVTVSFLAGAAAFSIRSGIFRNVICALKKAGFK